MEPLNYFNVDPTNQGLHIQQIHNHNTGTTSDTKQWFSLTDVLLKNHTFLKTIDLHFAQRQSPIIFWNLDKHVVTFSVCTLEGVRWCWMYTGDVTTSVCRRK